MRLAGIVDSCSGPMNVGSCSRDTRRLPPGMPSIARAVTSMYLIVTQHTDRWPPMGTGGTKWASPVAEDVSLGGPHRRLTGGLTFPYG